MTPTWRWRAHMTASTWHASRLMLTRFPQAGMHDDMCVLDLQEDPEIGETEVRSKKKKKHREPEMEENLEENVEEEAPKKHKKKKEKQQEENEQEEDEPPQ